MKMKPDVCEKGIPKVNGRCLDDAVYDITIAMYNMDYFYFRDGFIRHGGNEDMAWHIWDKWKSTHEDNFLWAYGNLDKKNREKVIATAMDYSEELKKR